MEALDARLGRLEDAVDNGRAAVIETARAEGLSMKESVARVRDIERRVAQVPEQRPEQNETTQGPSGSPFGESEPTAWKDDQNGVQGAGSVPPSRADWRDGESAVFFWQRTSRARPL
jgi:hypothetical protein